MILRVTLLVSDPERSSNTVGFILQTVMLINKKKRLFYHKCYKIKLLFKKIGNAKATLDFI